MSGGRNEGQDVTYEDLIQLIDRDETQLDKTVSKTW